MELVAYSVLDDKAGIYAHPFFVANDNIAIRTFADECKNPQSILNKHPEDFRLYRVGKFDDTTGVFAPTAKPEYITTAKDFIQTAPK